MAYYYADVAENSSGRKREDADELSAKYQDKVDELDDLNESVADDIADKKAEKEAGDWWGDKKKKDDKKSREVKGDKYGGSKQKDDEEDDFKSKKTAILDKDDEEELDESCEFDSKGFKNAAKLSKAPKAKLVKESASVRNHPIYTNPDAWDHYKKELDEEELGKATQELDEISKLAGISKPHADIWDDESGYDLDDPKHPTWAERQNEKADWAKDYARDNPSELDEFFDNQVTVTGTSNAKNDNTNTATGGQSYSGGSSSGVSGVSSRSDSTSGAAADAKANSTATNEMEMEEGNEFSGALAAAKATGAKDFEVDGKRYTVKEDININVTASGEEDAVNLIRKLSGMPMIAIAQHEEEPCDGAMEVEVDEERDPEYVNSPREQTAGIDAAIPSGTDLHATKRAYKIAQPGDNPMAVAEATDTSWDKYTSILKGLTK